jgi:hypothetical protein
MQHLDEGRIFDIVLDGTNITEAERKHLSLCAHCQRQVQSVTLLRDELAVAQLSQIGPEAERRLFSILASKAQDLHTGNAHSANPLHNLLGSLAEWVNALPLWDSRTQAGNVGIRNGNSGSYRMLFGARETEVELMVEPQNGLLRIIGEVMVADSARADTVALIELMAASDPKSALETESDASGRFALESVPPGRYVMTVTPRYSPMVVIESLELT